MCIHTMEKSSVSKKAGTIQATTWATLEDVILSKISQIQ